MKKVSYKRCNRSYLCLPKEVKAEPKKKGTNAMGEDVNGKTMLAGSTEVYTIDIDNDQYKGMTGLTDKDKQAGLMVVEKILK